MADYKGTGVVFMRKLIAKGGPEVEQAFLSKLSPEEAILYRKTLPALWVPVETITKFFVVAGPLLYPKESPNEGLHKIGVEMAKDNMRGIYSILVRILTPQYIIEQTAKLWSTYHKKGRASAVFGQKEKTGVFTVVDYPDLPERFAECTGGFIEGLLSMTGVQCVRAVKDMSNPNSIKWNTSWM